MSDTETNEIFAASLPETGIDFVGMIAHLKGGQMEPFVVAEEDDPCIGFFVEKNGPRAAIVSLIDGDMVRIFLTTKKELAGPVPEKEPKTKEELDAYFANTGPVKGEEFISFLKEIHEDPELQPFLASAVAAPAPAFAA